MLYKYLRSWDGTRVVFVRYGKSISVNILSATLTGAEGLSKGFLRLELVDQPRAIIGKRRDVLFASSC